MCKYMFYKEFNGRELLFCSKINDICGYSRFCNQKNKIIPTEWEKCVLKDRKEIPNGAKEVLFVRNGFLYIRLEQKNIKVKNTFDKVPEYVYIKEGIDLNDYELSLTPIEEKKTYSRRKNNIENE